MPGRKNNYFACPVDFILSLLGDKWTLEILRDLLCGKKRTSELLRSLEGISPRTLAQRLRDLESSQLIVRKVYAEIPPKVEYSLTERGYETRNLIRELFVLGERFQDVSMAGQSRQLDQTKLCLHCSRSSSAEPCLAIEQSLVLKKRNYRQTSKQKNLYI